MDARLFTAHSIALTIESTHYERFVVFSVCTFIPYFYLSFFELDNLILFMRTVETILWKINYSVAVRSLKIYSYTIWCSVNFVRNV